MPLVIGGAVKVYDGGIIESDKENQHLFFFSERFLKWPCTPNSNKRKQRLISTIQEPRGRESTS